MKASYPLLIILVCLLVSTFACNKDQISDPPDLDTGSEEPVDEITPPIEINEAELAFLRNRDLWLYANNREQQLTNVGDVIFMQWSPDGSKILFIRGVGATGNLWLMDADGNNQQQLAEGVFGQQPALLRSGLCWHPAGDKVAYLTKDELIVQSLDGSLIADVPLGYDYFGGPWWHPGGDTLAVWGAGQDYTANLYFYDNFGVHLETVQYVSSPYWSEHGLFFVQETEDADSGYLQVQGVYQTDSRGDNLRPVYQDPLLWSPLLAIDPGNHRLIISDAAHIHVVDAKSFQVEFSVESEVMNTQSEFAHPFWFALCPDSNLLAVLNYYLDFSGNYGDEGYWILRVYDLNDNFRGFDVWPKAYELYGQEYQLPVPMQGIQPFFWTRDGSSLLVLQEGDSEYDVWLIADVLASVHRSELPLLTNVSELYVRP